MRINLNVKKNDWQANRFRSKRGKLRIISKKKICEICWLKKKNQFLQLQNTLQKHDCVEKFSVDLFSTVSKSHFSYHLKVLDPIHILSGRIHILYTYRTSVRTWYYVDTLSNTNFYLHSTYFPLFFLRCYLLFSSIECVIFFLFKLLFSLWMNPWVCLLLIYIYIYIYHHHHHQIVLRAYLYNTPSLSLHPSLSPIAPDWSYKLYFVSTRLRVSEGI